MRIEWDVTTQSVLCCTLEPLRKCIVWSLKVKPCEPNLFRSSQTNREEEGDSLSPLPDLSRKIKADCSQGMKDENK